MLYAHYFDGRSSRVREVGLLIVGDDLSITGEGVDLRVPFRQVTVTERLGRAPRRLELPGGAYCEVRELDRLDELLAMTPHRDGSVDRLQRHWPIAVVAAVAFLAVVLAGYRWGLPWAAEIGARHLPLSVGHELSVSTLKALDGNWLEPSKLPPERQHALEQEFHALREPDGAAPSSKLEFRVSKALGANAFTLPDGTIILLDGLVTAMDNDQQIMAVLAHELGHAQLHHPLQMLLQGSAVAAFWALYVGDVSGILATAPTVLIQARYSRDLEQQADDYAARLLLQNHLAPSLLADALQKLLASHPEAKDSGYLSSHPATEQRMRRLRQQVAIT
jgi:Zn-dependent protease with chaperone function